MIHLMRILSLIFPNDDVLKNQMNLKHLSKVIVPLSFVYLKLEYYYILILLIFNSDTKKSFQT
ncbi:hypothetical protein GLOIN_2v1864131, partial [Rhizophagus irregularis DAOM 181602=DAOM 197198]